MPNSALKKYCVFPLPQPFPSTLQMWLWVTKKKFTRTGLRMFKVSTAQLARSRWYPGGLNHPLLGGPSRAYAVRTAVWCPIPPPPKRNSKPKVFDILTLLPVLFFSGTRYVWPTMFSLLIWQVLILQTLWPARGVQLRVLSLRRRRAGRRHIFTQKAALQSIHPLLEESFWRIVLLLADTQEKNVIVLSSERLGFKCAGCFAREEQQIRYLKSPPNRSSIRRASGTIYQKCQVSKHLDKPWQTLLLPNDSLNNPKPPIKSKVFHIHAWTYENYLPATRMHIGHSNQKPPTGSVLPASASWNLGLWEVFLTIKEAQVLPMFVPSSN